MHFERAKEILRKEKNPDLCDALDANPSYEAPSGKGWEVSRRRAAEGPALVLLRMPRTWRPWGRSVVFVIHLYTFL